MTGINGNHYRDDLPFEKYYKMKGVAEKYNII